MSPTSTIILVPQQRSDPASCTECQGRELVWKAVRHKYCKTIHRKDGYMYALSTFVQ